eukprot:COSAG06_NODE_47571_length_338_cov_0.907950_1_plen_35_part_01
MRGPLGDSLGTRAGRARVSISALRARGLPSCVIAL